MTKPQPYFKNIAYMNILYLFPEDYMISFKLTASDISKRLRKSQPLVREHLITLERDKLLKLADIGQKFNRKFYQITKDGTDLKQLCIRYSYNQRHLDSFKEDLIKAFGFPSRNIIKRR